MSKKILKSVLGLALATSVALASSGCSLIEKFNKLSDSTGKMGTDTSEMNKKISVTNKTTEDMRQEMNAAMKAMQDKMDTTNAYMGKQVYVDGRQGASLDLRLKVIGEMRKSQSQQDKIVNAGLFFVAYEYQLWKGYMRDDLALRDNLFQQAAMEFMLKVQEYMPQSRYRTPDPTSSDERMQDLYALAIAVDQVNPNQKLLLKGTSLPQVSMLDLILQGLDDMKLGAANPGLDPDTFQRQIQREEEAAVYLLQIRENFFPVMVLAKLTDINEPGFGGFWAKIKVYLGKWESQIQALNDAKILEFTDWLKKSNDLRDFLYNHNYAMALDRKVQKIYKNMKLDEIYPARLQLATPEKLAEYNQRVKAINAFVHEIERFRRDK